MSTKIENVKTAGNSSLAALGILVLGVAVAIIATPVSAAETDARMSVSRHHLSGGRDNPGDTRETTEDYQALITTGERSKSDTRGSNANRGDGLSQKTGSFDFWFYEADVILFNDDDGDGYYHGIDLLFDADTIYSSAEVYAVLYLSLEGGPWNEYGVTEDFTIFGSSANDEYVMVTELMSGYPSGSYDLLIELFDAYDGTFLTSYGPEDTSELGYLTLEDYNRDAPETQVVVNRGGGGGSMDGWILGILVLLLFASGIAKIWRRRNDTLMRIDSPAPVWRTYGDDDQQLNR